MLNSILLACKTVDHPLSDESLSIAIKAALKYKNRADFRIHDGYEYRLLQRVGLLPIVLQHMPKRSATKNNESGKGKARKLGRPAIEISPEDIREKASQYATKADFLANAATYYRKAREAGILSEVCQHMPLRRPKNIAPTLSAGYTAAHIAAYDKREKAIAAAHAEYKRALAEAAKNEK